MPYATSTQQVPEVAQAVRDTRSAHNMTLREFGEALDVSHNMIALWENGEREITTDRIALWLGDDRDWVRQLGVKVFAIKYAPLLANVASAPPTAPVQSASA